MPSLGRRPSSVDQTVYGCFQLLEYFCVLSHLDLSLSFLILCTMIGGVRGGVDTARE